MNSDTFRASRRQILAGGAALTALAAAPNLSATEVSGATGVFGDNALNALLDSFFYAQLDDSPESATSIGLDKGPRAGLKFKLTDRSPAARARRQEERRQRLTSLKAFNTAALTPAGKLDMAVAVYQLERAVDGAARFPYGSNENNYTPYAVSQQGGSYQQVPDFLDGQHRVADASDAEAWLSRLSAFATALDQDTDRLAHDASIGVVPPGFIIDTTLAQLDALSAAGAEKSVLVTSLVRKAAAAKLTKDYAPEAARRVAAEVFPALQRQRDRLAALRKTASEEAGVWRLPEGEAYYAGAVAASTTTRLTPDEVHQMGLDQVADITARIDVILKTQGMTTGTVAERLTALNDRPEQLYANTDEGREALLAQLNGQIKAMYGRLPQAFNHIPKASVEVKRVPPFIQDGAANGYYQRASLDGSRPASYFINLKDTHDWPKFGLSTLTWHEAVPGHHLQISLSQETPGLSLYRRSSFFSAFSEGWALYAEQLADELGVYENDPLGKAGYLQSFLFRAARLVVDSGMHHKRWSRAKATDYLVAATGFARPRTQREIDRYCVSPGQALSYKVGHTMWVKAREDAKARLGAKFDLKAYHDATLLHGALPLTILEQVAADWAKSLA
jgi:uncharacterized protein (DUF885 family)